MEDIELDVVVAKRADKCIYIQITLKLNHLKHFSLKSTWN